MSTWCDIFCIGLKSTTFHFRCIHLEVGNWWDPLFNGENIYFYLTSYLVLVRGTFNNSPQNLPCHHKRELLHWPLKTAIIWNRETSKRRTNWCFLILCPKCDFRPRTQRWRRRPRKRCKFFAPLYSKTSPWPRTCFCYLSFLRTKNLKMKKVCCTSIIFHKSLIFCSSIK